MDFDADTLNISDSVRDPPQDSMSDAVSLPSLVEKSQKAEFQSAFSHKQIVVGYILIESVHSTLKSKDSVL